MGSGCSRSPVEITSLLSYFHCPVLLPSLPPLWILLKSTSQKSHAFESWSQAVHLENLIQDTFLKGRELTENELSALRVLVQYPTERYDHCHYPHATDEEPQRFKHQLKNTHHGKKPAPQSPHFSHDTCFLLQGDLPASRLGSLSKHRIVVSGHGFYHSPHCLWPEVA